MSERRAIAQGIAAVGAGVINNACVKLLVAMPISEIILLRSAGTMIMLLPLIVRRGLKPPSAFIMLRAALEASATMLQIYALSLASLSFVATIMMSIPIGIMLISWFFLGESLSPRGRMLLLFGFVGGVVATAPVLSSSVGGVISAFGSALFYIARDIMTRRHSGTTSSVEMSFMASMVTMSFAILIGGATGWVDVPATDVAVITAMIGFYILSNVLIVSATRFGRPDLIASTRYSSVIWAILLDLLVLGKAPGVGTIAGAAMIVLCGLGLAIPEKRR